MCDTEFNRSVSYPNMMERIPLDVRKSDKKINITVDVPGMNKIGVHIYVYVFVRL